MQPATPANGMLNSPLRSTFALKLCLNSPALTQPPAGVNFKVRYPLAGVERGEIFPGNRGRRRKCNWQRLYDSRQSSPDGGQLRGIASNAPGGAAGAVTAGALVLSRR